MGRRKSKNKENKEPSYQKIFSSKKTEYFFNAPKNKDKSPLVDTNIKNMNSVNKPTHLQQPQVVDNNKDQNIKEVPKNKLESSKTEPINKSGSLKVSKSFSGSKNNVYDFVQNKIKDTAKIQKLSTEDLKKIPKSKFNDQINQSKLNCSDESGQNKSNAIPQKICFIPDFNEQQQIYNFADQIPKQSKNFNKMVNNSRDLFEQILKRKSSSFQYHESPKTMNDESDSILLDKKDKIYDNTCGQTIASSLCTNNFENHYKRKKMILFTSNSNGDEDSSHTKSKVPKDEDLSCSKVSNLKKIQTSSSSISNVRKFSGDQPKSLLKRDVTDTNFNVQMLLSHKDKSNLNQESCPQTDFTEKPVVAKNIQNYKDKNKQIKRNKNISPITDKISNLNRWTENCSEKLGKEEIAGSDFTEKPVVAKNIQNYKDKNKQIKRKKNISPITDKISNLNRWTENRSEKLGKEEIAGSSKKPDSYKNIKTKKKSPKKIIKVKIDKPKPVLVILQKLEKSKSNRKIDKLDKNLSAEQKIFIKEKLKSKKSKSNRKIDKLDKNLGAEQNIFIKEKLKSKKPKSNRKIDKLDKNLGTEQNILIKEKPKSKKSKSNEEEDKLDNNLDTEQNIFINKKLKTNSSKTFKFPKSTIFKKIDNQNQNIKPTLTSRIFNVNLLWKRDTILGCECNSAKKLQNPFFFDINEERVGDKILTLKSARLYNSKAFRMHEIAFSNLDDLQHIVTKLKPIIYVKELVMATLHGIGCVYSIVVQLVKDSKIVESYVKRHCFTEKTIHKTLLEMRISNYQQFDKIHYLHVLEPTPGKKLTSKEVISVEIGESLLMFPFETIQWTPPGPKVIVEKVGELPKLRILPDNSTQLSGETCLKDTLP